MSKFNGYGQTLICPVCGKEFYTPSQEWGYTMQTNHTLKYFCSWSCLRRYNLEKYGDKRGFISKWKKDYEEKEARKTR